MLSDPVADLFELAKHCREQSIRGLIVISGSPDVAELNAAEHLAAALVADLCERLDQELSAPIVHWVANDLPSDVPAVTKNYCLQHVHQQKASQLLGSDTSLVVINGFDTFNFNTFGQVINTLVGGGLLFLILPTENAIGQKNSVKRFYQLFRKIRDSHPRIPSLTFDANDLSDNFLLSNRKAHSNEAANAVESQPSTLQASVSQVSNSLPKKLTNDQDVLVDSLLQQLAERRCYAFVVGDRGRGKSTALGELAYQLVQQGKPIVVTASHKRQAGRLMSEVALKGVTTDKCRYLPADVLSESLVNVSDDTVLFVDEAASLSATLLHRLVDRFKRIVFASTAQGYEGSANGFYLRFRRHLDAIGYPMMEHRLSKPMRWSADCELEDFFNPLLGLSFPLLQQRSPITPNRAVSSGANFALEHSNIRKIFADDLISSEQLLQQVFSLLVQAHYQTQPNDLASLLDGLVNDGAAHLWVKQAGNSVLGVLLVYEEGGFDAESHKELIEQIVQGKRRPAGSLVPQKLAHETGDSSWCTEHSYRIVRIACDERYRRRGIGTELIDVLVEYAMEQGAGFISSSFGLDASLIRYWWENQFVPIFLGVKTDKASGSNNLIVARRLSGQAGGQISHANQRWRNDLMITAKRYMPNVPQAFINSLLESPVLANDVATNARTNENDSDRLQLLRFTNGELSMASAYASLVRWSRHRGSIGVNNGRDSEQMDAQKTVQLFVEDLPNWTKISAELNVPGQKQAQERLRGALNCLLARA